MAFVSKTVAEGKVIVFVGTKIQLKSLIQKDIPIRFRTEIGAININFSNVRLYEFIHSFGFPLGKKGNQLFIPRVFYDKNLNE